MHRFEEVQNHFHGEANFKFAIFQDLFIASSNDAAEHLHRYFICLFIFVGDTW
jgi:hypothetical protein